MDELQVDGEVIAEEDVGPRDATDPVRPLPAGYEEPSGSSLPVLRPEVKSAAIAAAGGVLAGAATVAAVRAVSGAASRARVAAPPRRAPPRPPERRRQPLLPGRRAPARSVRASSEASRSGRRRPTGCRGAARTGRCGCGAGWRPGSSTSTAARSWCGPGSRRADRVRFRAEAVDPALVSRPPIEAAALSGAGRAASSSRRRSSGCAARSGSTSTSRDFHRRFRRDRLRRPADPAAPGLPPRRPAVALGGARRRRWSGS